MRLRHLLVAVAALAATTTTAVHAQPVPAEPGPDDDLQCAAWAAIGAGLNQDDPAVASAFSIALAWFLARYEGASGKPFEEAMTPEFLNGIVPDLAAVEQECRVRMQEMGERLTDWGAELQASAQ